MDLDVYGGLDLTDFQRDLLSDTHTLIVGAGNRGSHKTSTSLMRIMDVCEKYPGIEGFIGRMVKKDLYKTIVSEWKKLYPPKLWEQVYTFEPSTSTEPEYIRFKNGSLIHLLPLKDIDRIRGANLGFFLIDQLEECPQKVWRDAVKVLRGSVWEEIKDENGNVIERRDVGETVRFGLATVNKNRGWYWIKRLFVKGIGFDKKPLPQSVIDRMRLIEPPVDENAQFWKEGYYDLIVANAESQSEIDFEVYGKDPDEFGLVFPEFHRDTHTCKFEFNEPKFKDAAFMIGYDEGFDVPSAFLFLAITPDGTHWWRAEHYAARMTISQHQAKLMEISNTIGFPLNPQFCRYVADRSISGKMDGNGISIADQWGKVWPWENGKKDPPSAWIRMRELMILDEQDKSKWMVHEEDCPNFLEEIEEAEYDTDKPGKLLRRCKDHALDTAGYMTLTAMQAWEKRAPVDLRGTTKHFFEVPRGACFELPVRAQHDWPLMVPKKKTRLA